MFLGMYSETKFGVVSPLCTPGAGSAAVLADGQLLTWGGGAGAAGGQGIPRAVAGLGEHVVVQACPARAAAATCSGACGHMRSASKVKIAWCFSGCQAGPVAGLIKLHTG